MLVFVHLESTADALFQNLLPQMCLKFKTFRLFRNYRKKFERKTFSSSKWIFLSNPKNVTKNFPWSEIRELKELP